MKSLLNCASGGPGFRCKILDSGRILQTKEPFFWWISLEDLFLPVIFLDVFLLFGIQIFGVNLASLQ